MIWLIGQIWPLLVVSALAGALVVAWWGQRRVTTEVWEDVPVVAEAEPDEGTEGIEDEAGGSVGTAVSVDADDPDSPFPVAPGQSASWEAEELWSRPVQHRTAAGKPTGPRPQAAPAEAAAPADEWHEAAQNWRTWAAGATGRGYDQGASVETGSPLDPADRDLFSADRSLGTDRPAGSSGPTFPLPADEADDFPYARPVEASEPAGETMDPMEPVDEMDDDEREAAEIRRMRLRRGDAE